ncbi:MAG: helix-turn-helix domain-containing protein [Bdellovibrionales bacterium]|nr:helix-turn-helix domain-containing protein [Bdellovibrionales bacterium]
MVEFLDIAQAAEFLRVKPSTLYAWVHQRRIPFRKHGRRVVFDRQDLAFWSDSQAVQPLGGGGGWNARAVHDKRRSDL